MMTPKLDPYSTKLHTRINVLLLVLAIIIFAVVLRTSAHGQTWKDRRPREDDWEISQAVPYYSFASVANFGSITGSELEINDSQPANARPRRVAGFESEKQGAADLPLATDFTWVSHVNGKWSVGTNWSPAGVPNGVGYTARYNGSLDIVTTQDIAAGATLGTLAFESSDDISWTINLQQPITFDNAKSGATISNSDSSAGFNNALILSTGTLTLADDLFVSNTGGSTNATGAIQIASTIGGSGNVTFSNVSTVISQAGAINLQGGPNTFMGSVLIQNGTVTYDNASSFGNSANVITLGQSGQGSAALLSTSGGVLANNIIVAPGSTLGALGTGAAGYSGTVTLNGFLNVISAVTDAAGLDFSNTISGTGSMSKSGTGLLTLSHANTFTGNFIAYQGTTNLNANGALGSVLYVDIFPGATGATIKAGVTGLTNAINDTANVDFEGGTLNLAGGGETIGALIGPDQGATSASLVIGDLSGSPGSLTVTNNYSNAWFRGVISGTKTTAGPILTLQGTGTLLLSNTNTYAGGTLISGGTLYLSPEDDTNPVQILANTTNITVNSGGTLLLQNFGAANAINDSATITLAGGTFQLGVGTSERGGTVAAPTAGVGALTLTATSTINFSGSNGIIEFAGIGAHTMTSGPDLLITNWDGTAITGGGAERLLFAGMASDFTNEFSASDVSFNGTFGYDAIQFGDYYEIAGLQPVPEPATWAAGLLAAAAVACSQRRRFRALVRRPA